MTDFVFETTPKLVCEAGAAARLGEMAKALGIRRALIVTDAGLVAAGLLEPVQAGFAAAGSACVLFSDVLADPPEASVALAVQAARDAEADGVIGFGGGSSLDTAKLVALLAGTPQNLPDIYGIGLAKGPRLPLIQVPTTAGTGSEVTPIAIVTTPTSEKKGVVSSLLYPDLAVLDARLTLGLPPRVTAMTGIDAMVHAIEAYTTRHKKNPLSDSLALRALSLLGANIRTVIEDGRNVAARAAMLQGSLLAGIAFANAPVGAVHALAYPLGGHFHVPHGLSNALVLLPVLEFNRPAAETLYAELAPAILPGRSFATPAEAAVGFIGAMRDLVAAMPMEQRLEEVGVRREDLPMLAADAMKVQRLLINNPREVSYDDALAIYGQAY
ncbi:iron-containing alcohol dehydrogenase [Azospirillum doebereinerae]|uniref:iron-containing alcohol dehydrogenase n=1 Tax=Azospirillum doebereinerae TaxID=92933 RepID=UPI001EE56B7D|nr:iron-containing alcohol dehydrogenase [Azospirillum doebereinerae]MCG5242311.1 iron-containing alcohol dehydrogenase [Azospirillum doebereinerae]